MYNLEKFKWFCNEREAIRIKKDNGDMPPYTTDPILHRHKFTNVNRAYDRGTRLLWRCIESFSDKDIVYAVCLYRFSGSFNEHIEMMAGTNQQSWNKQLILKRKLFNMTAYQANFGSGKNRGMHFLRSTLPIFALKLYNQLVLVKTPLTIEACADMMCDILESLKYLRMQFQSTEVAKDLSCIRKIWVDPNSKCNLGPGALKGIQYTFKNSITNEDAMLTLLQIFPNYNYAILEHALCEYSKWCEYQLGIRKHTNKIYQY